MQRIWYSQLPWPPSFSHDPHIVPDIFAPMEVGGPHVSIIQAQVDGYGVEVERTFFLGNAFLIKNSTTLAKLTLSVISKVKRPTILAFDVINILSILFHLKTPIQCH